MFTGNYPVGQEMDYRTAKDRYTSEEARTLDRLHNDIYAEARQAAEAHRQVTNYAFHINTIHRVTVC